MIQIRSGVFETNSSSTHSICIPKKTKSTVNFIDFKIGKFGWANESVDPASYLYTAILSAYSYDNVEDKLKVLTDILNEHDIAYRFEKPKWYTYDDGYRVLDNGYVDHSYETQEFVESVLSDGDMLVRFLSEGLVYTGNDNQDDQPNGCNIANEYFYEYDDNWNEKPNPYHDEENYDYFYKGN
jgi:hypothetical protein